MSSRILLFLHILPGQHAGGIAVLDDFLDDVFHFAYVLSKSCVFSGGNGNALDILWITSRDYSKQDGLSYQKEIPETMEL